MERIKVETIDRHKLLVYTLETEEILDSFILGMMENNRIPGLLPVHYLQKDEQQVLKYDISRTVLLSDFLTYDTDGMKLVLILKDLADILLEANEYMIEETAFLFGLYSVFVARDGKGRLICLPVENRKGMTFRQFCLRLMELPSMAGRYSHGALSHVYAYLNTGEFSIREFSIMLDKLELQSAVISPVKHPKDKVVLRKKTTPIVLGEKDRVQKNVRQSALGDSSKGYLYRQSTKEKIVIDRPEFRIGKSRENVDYCINDNPSVSRRHAVIIQQEGRYFIEDTDSLNHTYVDRRLLRKGQCADLANGTSIRLADEEFVFLTEKD